MPQSLLQPTPLPRGDSGSDLESAPTKISPLPVRSSRPPTGDVEPWTVAPGAVIGEYVLEAKVGEGGMGEIWRGTQPLIGKKVAVKILRRKVAEEKESVARFIQEARAVNAIRHRGLIDIFSFGDLPDGRPYFVMEFLEGESLTARLGATGPLRWGEILDIVTQICAALQAAHEHGIIHRDLKSENIFLVPDKNGKTLVKILDFGIAKLTNSEDENAQLTQAGDIFGTPAYMSPEQCNGSVTHRSDIYSLGIILFEMITGRTPFFTPGDRAAQVLIKQVSEPAPAPSSMVSGRRVPREVDEFVLRILSKDPQGRPLDCERLAQEAQAVVGPFVEVVEPTLQVARPVYRDQPRKSGRRSFWVWAVILPLVVGGAALGAWLLGKSEQTRPAALPVAVPPPPMLPSDSQTQPSRPNMVLVEIETTPKGAEVWLDDKLLGLTPLSREVEYGDEPRTLTLTKEGRQSKQLAFTPNKAQMLTVDLLSANGKRPSKEKDEPKDESPKEPKEAKEPREPKKEPRSSAPKDKDGLAVPSIFQNH